MNIEQCYTERLPAEFTVSDSAWLTRFRRKIVHSRLETFADVETRTVYARGTRVRGRMQIVFKSIR